ncbi:MAG: HAD-IIB family hydrolase [bacterium]|nr:HAD-IIB family hydrolase [bacterium]
MTDRFVVFTDLDGTLLDHHTYSFEPAAPAIERLRRNAVPLILTSSKTMAEIMDLRRRLNNQHPLIAENGSLLAIPENHFRTGDRTKTERVWPRLMGPGYQQIVKVLQQLREEHGFQFEGFADWDAERVVEATGLPAADAQKARERLASEPIQWRGSAESWKIFTAELERCHLRTLRGGRFDHILGAQADKAHAMQKLLEMYTEHESDVRWQTIAAGDSPNDLSMLEHASIAVVIPAASGKTLDAAKGDSTLFASDPGPVGWNAAINEILDRFQLP